MEQKAIIEQWWIAGFDNTLIWARLRIFASGTAEIFDCDGQTQHYPDEDSAHAALLDAEFRAFDGLDEDDANLMGFSLEELAPPEADNDEALVPRMTLRLRH